MNNRDITYYSLLQEFALDGEIFNLIPHTNEDNTIVIGLKDNEDVDYKRYVVAAIYSFRNQTNFYEELKNSSENLTNLFSIKKDYPHLTHAAGIPDCVKKGNILLRQFYDEYKQNFDDVKKYIYASLLRNITSIRSALSMVYYISEFAMMALLRQAFEQIGYCSYIITEGINSICDVKKKPNETIGYINEIKADSSRLYGVLSDKTNINFDQFNLYFDNSEDKVIERSLINLDSFIDLFRKITELQLLIIRKLINEFSVDKKWYIDKIDEIIKGHNLILNIVDNNMIPPTLDF